MEAPRKRSPVGIILILVLIVFFFIGVSLIMLRLAGERTLALGKDKVGVVEVKGVLTDPQNVLKQLQRFRQKDQIKAIVLRVNSPGGAVGPAQEILRQVEKIRPHKKIVASLGTVAASGGYYVSCGADYIMANPGTLTGSIGVIMQFTNMAQLVHKLGLDLFNIKAGKFKDVGTPFREMTPEEKAYIQQLIDDVHEQFITDIAKGRKLPVDKIRPLADGRVFTGEEAKKFGLVDGFGNLDDAVEKAGRLAGITGKVEAVYPPKEKFSLWNLVMGEDLEETINRLSLTTPVPLYLYDPGRP